MNAIGDPKARVAASIEKARADLERALADLDRVPVADPAAIGYIAHALNNYLTVASATVELLQLSLHSQAKPEVTAWLDGLHHLADLMQHTVGKLLRASPAAFPLKPDFVNVSLLLERACQVLRAGRAWQANRPRLPIRGRRAPCVGRPRRRCGGGGQPALERRQVLAIGWIRTGPGDVGPAVRRVLHPGPRPGAEPRGSGAVTPLAIPARRQSNGVRPRQQGSASRS